MDKRFSWTQPCCVDCWNERNPGRRAHTLNGEHGFQEVCVYCGSPTRSGIYVRVDPKEVPHPTHLKED